MSFVVESLQVYGVNVTEFEGLPNPRREEDAWRAFVEAHRVELGLSEKELEGVLETGFVDWLEEYEYRGMGPAAVVAHVVDARIDGIPDGTVSLVECDDADYIGVLAASLFPWEAAEYAARWPEGLCETLCGELELALSELGAKLSAADLGEWFDTVSG